MTDEEEDVVFYTILIVGMTIGTLCVVVGAFRDAELAVFGMLLHAAAPAAALLLDIYHFNLKGFRR